MSTTQSSFEQLEELSKQGHGPVLDFLIEKTRSEKNYHGLFSALQMKARSEVGLPLVRASDSEEMTDEQRRVLEDRVLEACREAGMGLVKEGHVRDGWMYYLRAVGETDQLAKELRSVSVNDENMDEIVEVALYEGVAPDFGFGLVLQNYGTCNAITTYESAMHQQSIEMQQKSAAQLVRHLHDELMATVKADIAGQEDSEPQESTLGELVAERDWMFNEHSYHIDTTHLASTVRFARVVDDPEVLKLAIDLTEYGRRLSDQFQYEQEEPFSDLYPSHAHFFNAILGNERDAALDYFREKAENVDVNDHGTLAVETYIELLTRTGASDQALAAHKLLAPHEQYASPRAPTLFELSRSAQDFETLLETCRERNDLVGFATGLMHKGGN